MNSLSYPFAGLFGLGGGELVLIFAIVILLFGAKKLPDLAKGLGKSIKEFKKASSEADEDDIREASGIKHSIKSQESEKSETTKTHGSN